MKKLLATAAVCGLVIASAPAHADIDLEMGGFFTGYGVFGDTDKDSAVTSEENDVDFVRNTELHFTGETTLDNGLTVGAHFEINADNDTATSTEITTQESYVYFSSSWGRFNVGAEDGAAYLLQVAAPSADENIDGIRQTISPFNYGIAQTGAGATNQLTNLAVTTQGVSGGLDYDQDTTGWSDKVTYLSPIMNGFQVGLSYVFDVTDASNENVVDVDNVANTFGSAYEASARYEGSFDNVGYTIGAGYTVVEEEAAGAAGANNATDDRTVWNVGADFDIGAFGIGVSYMEDDFGEVGLAGATRDDEETLVVGVDYTTGAFKLGASYMDQDGTANLVGATGNDGVETERWTGGVVYSYAPGVSFRGSISHVQHDNVAQVTGTGTTVDATSFVVGTQINF